MSALDLCFQALSARLEALRATLAAEGEALLKGDADALAEYAGHKEEQATALRAAWDELTSRLGLSEAASREAVEQAIIRAEPGLIVRWTSILSLIDEIGGQNRFNGQLIQEQLRRTQTALDILQTVAGQNALYGADGHSIELFTLNRSIDEA